MKNMEFYIAKSQDDQKKLPGVGTGLRQQFLRRFAALSVAALAILLPFSSWLLGDQFTAFERESAQRDLQRISLLLSQEQEALLVSAKDYGEWIHAVEYIQGKSVDFTQSNFPLSIHTNFSIDQLFILDTALNPAFTQRTTMPVDGLRSEQELALSKMDSVFLGKISKSSVMQDSLRLNEAHVGFTYINNRWWLLAVSPIRLPNQVIKPTSTEGWIGFVREMNQRRLSMLGDQAQVPFSLAVAPNASSAPSIEFDSKYLRMSAPVMSGQSPGEAQLKVYIKRPLVIQSTWARVLIITNTLIIVLAGLVGLWMFIERRVVERLERLDSTVQDARAGLQTNFGIAMNGDEIDSLAESFTTLIQELGKANDRWKYEARHDSLTGLPNRAALLSDLDARVLDRWLVLIDLRGFRSVNDIYGNRAGDEILSSVSKHLQRIRGTVTQIYRLGNDEFVLLAEPGSDINKLVEDINIAVVASTFGQSWERRIYASIGYMRTGSYEPTLASSEQLICVQAALGRAKKSTGPTALEFDEQMLADLTERMILEQSLGPALDNIHIDAWMQPIVCAKTGRVRRFEALARWNDPERGMIPPIRFVEIAETSNMTTRLDLHVLERAIIHLQHVWERFPGLSLSFNASVQSLLDTSYPDKLLALIEKHHVPTGALRLEITETALAENEAALQPPLARLMHAGIEFELDDFGVGYSSLARLAALRPAGLKLDGSFVRSIERGGARVARAILEMANQLNIEVTAECVETASQFEFLQAAGCAELQGYLFAKPMPIDELERWLDQNLGTSPIVTPIRGRKNPIDSINLK